MKIIGASLLSIISVGVCLVLHGCAVLTVPIASEALGGAQLAMKGAELEQQVKKADVETAIGMPFEQAWDRIIMALVSLDIELTRAERNTNEDGGIIESTIEGLAHNKKVKIIAVKLTGKITEVGIWANHDKALAELIADKIKEEALRQYSHG
jgi:hypothetical protein